MNRPIFNEVLIDNNEYQTVKNNLDLAVMAYKDNQNDTTLEILDSLFNQERALYKSFWKQHQETYGWFETVTEYDYMNIYNEEVEGNKAYALNQYQQFKNNNFSFEQLKRVSKDTIINFHKIFLGKWSFHPVAPCKNASFSYVEHIKEVASKFYIDKENEVLLIVQ